MSRRFKIILAAAIIILMAILGYLYFRAVLFVRQEVEAERDRITARQDGSILEWSDYKIEGLDVVFENFHYYDAPEKMDYKARSLRATGRLNGQYNLEAESGIVQIDRNDELRFDKLIINGFKNADRLTRAAVEKIQFDNLLWLDLSGTNSNVSTKTLTINEYDNLYFKEIKFADLVIDTPSNQMQFLSGPIDINGLRFIQSKKERIIGFLYEAFEVPNIAGFWYDRPMLRGEIHSSGQFAPESNLIESGALNADFELTLSRDQINQKYGTAQTPTDQIGRFLTRLPGDEINGELHINALVSEGEQSRFRTELIGNDLGAFTVDIEFTGYHPRILRDLDNYISNPDRYEELPQSLVDLKMHSALIDYQDGELANIYIENFANIDPAVASFMAQMTLPRYMPNDRELVRETSDALTGFLRGKEQLSIAVKPEQPIPMTELIEIFQNQGPYKEPLGVSVTGK